MKTKINKDTKRGGIYIIIHSQSGTQRPTGDTYRSVPQPVPRCPDPKCLIIYYCQLTHHLQKSICENIPTSRRVPLFTQEQKVSINSKLQLIAKCHHSCNMACPPASGKGKDTVKTEMSSEERAAADAKQRSFERSLAGPSVGKAGKLY